jgi:hypothetical protein
MPHIYDRDDILRWGASKDRNRARREKDGIDRRLLRTSRKSGSTSFSRTVHDHGKGGTPTTLRRVTVKINQNQAKNYGKNTANHIDYMFKLDEQGGFDRKGGDITRSEAQERLKGQHVIKIILSPEDRRLANEQYARAFMDRMDGKLGFRTEWVAVIHDDTRHPHIHITVSRDKVPDSYRRRSLRDKRNGLLYLQREDFFGKDSSARKMAMEEATRILGPISRTKVRRDYRKSVRNNGYAGPDQDIKRLLKLTGNGKISPDRELRYVTPWKRDAVERRLKILSDRDVGVQRSPSGRTYRFSDHWEANLRQRSKIRSLGLKGVDYRDVIVERHTKERDTKPFEGTIERKVQIDEDNAIWGFAIRDDKGTHHYMEQSGLPFREASDLKEGMRVEVDRAPDQNTKSKYQQLRIRRKR